MRCKDKDVGVKETEDEEENRKRMNEEKMGLHYLHLLRQKLSWAHPQNGEHKIIGIDL